VKRTIIWHDRISSAAERCVLSAPPGGFRLDGTVVTSAIGVPLLVTYGIRVDSNWHTRYVDITVEDPDTKSSLKLLADSYGGWFRDGVELANLKGCIDIDLGVSPSTNTLPIRRLALSVGQSRDVDAAWVRFPELTISRLAQRYERIEANRYRYSSGKFEGELVVDDDGLVVDYAAAWIAVAKK
jgi:hypothetical protein